MPLHRRPRSPHWHYDFTVQGHRFRGSTQTPDRRTAEAVEAKLRADAILGGLTGQKPRFQLDHAFGKYLIEHAAHLPARSRKTIEGQLATLLDGLGKDHWLDHDVSGRLSDYVARRRGQKIRRPGKAVRVNPDRLVSPATVNHEVALLKTVYRMADLRWGWAVRHPDWKAFRLPQKDGRARHLRHDEALRVMAELDKPRSRHIRGIVEMALLTGLRLGQVIRLDWSQVDLAGGTMAFLVKSRKHKDGKRIVLPVSQDLRVLLANQGPREAGPVWLRKGRWPVKDIKWGYNAAVRRAGVTDFTFHDLRHTYATWQRQRRVPLEVLRRLLGHADIRTTQRYAHVGDAEVIAAAEAASEAAPWRAAEAPDGAERKAQDAAAPAAKRAAG